MGQNDWSAKVGTEYKSLKLWSGVEKKTVRKTNNDDKWDRGLHTDMLEWRVAETVRHKQTKEMRKGARWERRGNDTICTTIYLLNNLAARPLPSPLQLPVTKDSLFIFIPIRSFD